MVFSSSVFLFAFLPVFLVLYFVLPWRPWRNAWLLAASLVFYAWGEPVYVLLMVVSIVANWGFGLAIGRSQRSVMRSGGGGEGESAGEAGADVTPGHSAVERALLVAAVLFVVPVIRFFKYEGFLAANVNSLIGSALVPDLQLPLPIGISFYTLQALSYVIDVYRREVEPQRNLAYLGMYVACFPQLIVGPIVRYQTIQDQVVGRRETLDGFASGLRLFIVGLAKKALLANTVAILATKMLSMGGPQIGAVGAWFLRLVDFDVFGFLQVDSFEVDFELAHEGWSLFCRTAAPTGSASNARQYASSARTAVKRVCARVSEELPAPLDVRRAEDLVRDAFGAWSLTVDIGVKSADMLLGRVIIVPRRTDSRFEHSGIARLPEPTSLGEPGVIEWSGFEDDDSILEYIEELLGRR